MPKSLIIPLTFLLMPLMVLCILLLCIFLYILLLRLFHPHLVPPPLRRRVPPVNANPPCAFFTPPHRCIVCLTQTHAPSLSILARRALRFALRDQLQHCH